LSGFRGSRGSQNFVAGGRKLEDFFGRSLL
jgi:hypothetical protein